MEQTTITPDATPRDDRRSVAGMVKAGLVGAVVAASFGIWIYAYSGAASGDRPFTDLLDDPTFSDAANPICTATMEDLSELPNALEAESATERADHLDVANRLLYSMVDDLAAIDQAEASDRDRGMINQWLDEYRVFVDDRQRWAGELRRDPTARPTYTNLGTGRIETRLTWFAEVNNMAVCSTPEDIG